MPRSSSRIGERLLELIPKPRKSEPSGNRPRGSVASYLLALTLVNSLSRLLLIAILAALCGTAVLFILNAEAKAVDTHKNNALMGALLFSDAVCCTGASQNYLIKFVSREVEGALDRQRQRVVYKVF